MNTPNHCASPNPNHNTFANIMEHIYGWCVRHRRRIRTTCFYLDYGSFFHRCGPERCPYFGRVCSDPPPRQLCSNLDELPYPHGILLTTWDAHGTLIRAEYVRAQCPRLQQRGCFTFPATPAT